MTFGARRASTTDDQTNEIDSALVTVANSIGFGCR